LAESMTFIGFLFFWILIFSLLNIVAGYDIAPGDLELESSTLQHSVTYPVIDIFL